MVSAWRRACRSGWARRRRSAGPATCRRDCRARAARVRLAVFLLFQYADADAESHGDALRLLREAVALDVPGARNMLGVTFWDDGALGDAEDCLRAAVADGDPDALVNLAGVLHAKNDDATAFALLREAAERGDGPAYGS